MSPQRSVEIGSYSTVWAMLHRLRSVLVRPGQNRLTGTVGVDETYIGGKEPGLRGGRAKNKNAPAGVTVEVFDPLIHAPHRLRICAMLSQAEGIEIQNRTGLSKSARSNHLTQLVDAGQVSEEQFARAGRSRLMLSLTSQGQAAYTAQRKALEDILASDESGTSSAAT